MGSKRNYKQSGVGRKVKHKLLVARSKRFCNHQGISKPHVENFFLEFTAMGMQNLWLLQLIVIVALQVPQIQWQQIFSHQRFVNTTDIQSICNKTKKFRIPFLAMVRILSASVLEITFPSLEVLDFHTWFVK